MLNVLRSPQQAYGEIGLSPPSQIVGGNNPDGVQILALLNREGNELARVEQPFPVLRGEQLITLVPGQQAYAFPDRHSLLSPGNRMGSLDPLDDGGAGFRP
jgi:hypothetical protein